MTMDDRTLIYILRTYEKKLYELMGENEYSAFIVQTARDAFRMEIERMEDGKLKEFILLYFDEITHQGDEN